MDIAYDHIQESSFSPTVEITPSIPSASTQSPERNGETTPTNAADTTPRSASESASAPAQSPGLNAEFQQAFKAVSSSPWGSTIGGWFSSARKQGSTFYQDLQREATEAHEQASRGLSNLREQVASRTRALSLTNAPPGAEVSVPGEEPVPVPATAATSPGRAEENQREDATRAPTRNDEEGESEAGPNLERPESLPADIVKEAGSLVASLRVTAASKLKDLQRAEDAADEALLAFGRNVRDFLRDAVTITAPGASATAGESGDENEILFETNEPGTGRKVFHTTRLDAQLHAIHTTASSFTADPAANEARAKWKAEFDVGKQTTAIARDLEKYEELRRAMERLVPEKVEYAAFWTRYYFLREAVEEDERRRREILKGASAGGDEEEVGWGDDDDEDDGEQGGREKEEKERVKGQANNKPDGPATKSIAGNKTASESTATLSAPSLKPGYPSPRRSNDYESKSIADSDASYDIVSGATSRAMGSPKEEKRVANREGEDSGDDWE